jgi:hypothetical protein
MINFPRSAAAAGALAVAVCLSLTACGPGTGQAAPQAGSSQDQSGQRGGQRPPGVSGKIADVSGRTLQVQGSSGQTAVSYTSKTAITEVTAATAKALAVGLCATVRSAKTSSASPAATPSDQFSAASVMLSDPTGGSCRAGFGGTRPAGAPTARPSPSGAPSGRLSGAPVPGGRGFGAIGKVTSVDGVMFVVEGDQPGAAGQAATTKITVTTTSATTWSRISKATAKAVVAGRCAFANGTTDDTGAMTAATLRISKPENGSCAIAVAGAPGSRRGQR